jgi:CRISPR/Cas system-associated exonuclease Cas4 (RecB family)
MTVSKFASKTKKKKAVRKYYDFPNYWSYSRWEVFDKCRARYEYQFLQKLPQPEAPALQRGIRVHEEGEEYLDGTRKRLPASYAQFNDEMRAIKKLKASAEGSYAFTKSWQTTSPTDWSNCWLRIKIDAEVVNADEVTLVDFKTGKPWPKATEAQSELYAVGAFLKFPDADTITVEFWYLDSGEVVPYVYTRKQFTVAKKKWAARGREVIAARQFPPTNNGYNCKYCPFRSDAKLGNGQPGPCDAWKKAK